jgi:CRP/FNR family transcriptional regulator, cyclic AMP receptor protein
MADDLKALRGTPLFSALSDKDLVRVQSISKVVTHEEGQSVVEEDQTAIGFHLILEGSADALVAGVSVAQLGPGSYFGEMSLLDGKPRSATVKATSTLQTLVIPSWDFNRMLDQHPEMMRGLLVELCRRLRKIEGARG